jgi:hypothetical protein
VVPERHLLGEVVVAVGAGSDFLPGPLNTLSGLVSQRSGMDRLLHLRSGLWPPAHDLLQFGTGRLRSRWLPRHHPPSGRGRRGVRGRRNPLRRPQSEEAAPPTRRWRPVLAVAGIPPWRDSG